MSDKKTEVNTAREGEKELLETLGAIREEVGKNHTDLQARLATVETAREQEKADFGKLKEELAEIKNAYTQREAIIRELQQRNLVKMEADPIKDSEKALGIFGMMIREGMARMRRVELPKKFAIEREQVDRYMTDLVERDVIERATVEEIASTGNFFVPTILQADIWDTLAKVGDLLSKVDFLTGMPSKGTRISRTGRPTLQPKRSSTGTSITQSDPAWSSWSWDTDEAGFAFPMDNWLFSLSPVAIGQEAVNMAYEAYLFGLTRWLVLADGGASYNSNTGILADTVNVARMAGSTFETVVNADLNTLINALLPQARGAAEILMGTYAMSILEDVTREGKLPILKEAGDGSIRVKGHSVILDEDMPVKADSQADKAFIAAGNPKTWAVVVAANGIQVASDASVGFKENQTWFRALAHIDIVRKPGNTWALLKTKA